MERNSHSILIAAACIFLIFSVSGCTTISTEAVKKAIEKRRHEPCQCEPTHHEPTAHRGAPLHPPITIIIMED